MVLDHQRRSGGTIDHEWPVTRALEIGGLRAFGQRAVDPEITIGIEILFGVVIGDGGSVGIGQGLLVGAARTGKDQRTTATSATATPAAASRAPASPEAGASAPDSTSSRSGGGPIR